VSAVLARSELSDEMCRRAYIDALQIDAMLHTSVHVWPTVSGGCRIISENARDVELTRTDRALAYDYLVTKIRGMVK
jgi:hypothetical protein